MYKRMTAIQTQKAIASHERWLKDSTKGKQLDLYQKDISNMNFSSKNLKNARFTYCNLSQTNFSHSDLSGSYFSKCILGNTYFCESNLTDCAFISCILHKINLRLTDMKNAKIDRSSTIGHTTFAEAKNAEHGHSLTRILPEGDIIGWKKCRNDVIVKLLIPAKAKRSHGLGRKCRAEYVKVLEVFKSAVGVSTYDGNTKYRKGETVHPDMWDESNRECSNGIHFFITRKEAEDYYV